jgi:hypothetical protein
MVTYSLSSNGVPGEMTRRHAELLYSVESLRLFNDVVPVHVFLYGEHPPAFTGELARHGVAVHDMGGYEAAIRRVRPRGFRALALYPVLHKWLNFAVLSPLAPAQILQLDCDTLFLGDVAQLFERYRERHFYAREEPWSRASHHGYNPAYLDEDALQALARQLGATPIRPYNLGVCLLNHQVWMELARRCTTFLSYVFRFNAWRWAHPDSRAQLAAELRRAIELDLAEMRMSDEEQPPLPLPASNPWIAEQVALWLTLGGIPAVSDGCFAREHVLQGREQASATGRVVYHYFGIDKDAFLSQLGGAAR